MERGERRRCHTSRQAQLVRRRWATVGRGSDLVLCHGDCQDTALAMRDTCERSQSLCATACA